MGINKKTAVLILCILVAITVGGCTTLETVGDYAMEAADTVVDAGVQLDETASEYLLSLDQLPIPPAVSKTLESELVLVDVGRINRFDENNSVVVISCSYRPGLSAETDSVYKVRVLLGSQIIGSGITKFDSLSLAEEGYGRAGLLVCLSGEQADEFIEALFQTPEYIALAGELVRIKESEDAAYYAIEKSNYNYIVRGDAPVYEEMLRIRDLPKELEAEKKQVKQMLLDFPYSARLPDSFTGALIMDVEQD